MFGAVQRSRVRGGFVERVAGAKDLRLQPGLGGLIEAGLGAQAAVAQLDLGRPSGPRCRPGR
jgi:hypothetical protein